MAPTVAMQVISECGDVDADFSRIETYISADPALAARVLRMANSTMFGGHRRVGSVRDALVRLGLNVTRVAVMGFALAADLSRKAPEGFDRDYYWRFALGTASAARLVAQMIHLQGADSAFAAGLLQDLGVLALHCVFPERYGEVVAEAADPTAEPLWQIESRRLGAVHPEVGATLLCEWGVPASIHQPIQYHHMAETDACRQCGARVAQLAGVLQFADAAARVLADPEGAPAPSNVFEIAYRHFDFSMETTAGLMDQVHQALSETAEIFDLDPATLPNLATLRQRVAAEMTDAVLEAEVTHRGERERAQEGMRRVEHLHANLAALQDKLVHDDLTRVLVRSEFMRQLEENLAWHSDTEMPMSVVMLDIDHFKRVNDDLGHLSGDKLLKFVGEYLHSHIRQNEVAGRYGGDEFTLLINGLDLERSVLCVERLLREVTEQSRFVVDRLNGITLSAGLAFAPCVSAGLTAETFLHKADGALYVAKRAGRNCVRHTVVE